MIKMSGKAKTTWGWVSKYIRLRDSDDNGWCKCCTCGTVKHWKEMQAGHFQSRKHNATAWDERNINAQCVSCNEYNHGEQFLHGQYIDEKYGEGTGFELYREARKHCKKPDDNDLDAIKNKYKLLVNELSNKHLLKE